VSIWVNLPNNPTARDSVTRYLRAMKSVLRRVTDGRHADPAVQAVSPEVTDLAYTDGN